MRANPVDGPPPTLPWHPGPPITVAEFRGLLLILSQRALRLEEAMRSLPLTQLAARRDYQVLAMLIGDLAASADIVESFARSIDASEVRRMLEQLSERVAPVVREVMADHAEDEASAIDTQGPLVPLAQESASAPIADNGAGFYGQGNTDEDRARLVFERACWPNGVCCSNCNSSSISYLQYDKCYRCRKCANSFNVKSGTCLYKSKLTMATWLELVKIAKYANARSHLKRISSQSGYNLVAITTAFNKLLIANHPCWLAALIDRRGNNVGTPS